MLDNSSAPIVVLMSASNREEGSRIAELLIDSGLAACVQILSEVQSIYRWKGEIARDSEVLLLAKTTREVFADLEARVREVHSYETPEILALDVTAISEPYLKWLVNNLGDS